MAELFLRSRTPFWKIELAGSNFTVVFQKFVSSITVNYSLSKPASARIHVTSPSVFEGLITEGVSAKVYMGWTPYTMALMMQGIVVGLPEGNATEFLDYTITIGDDIVDMATEEKNTVPFSATKREIIFQVLSKYGFVPIVNIADSLPISVPYLPLQKCETDLEFIKRSAEQWNCVYWTKDRYFYFVDAQLAHNLGDAVKIPTINDFTLSYVLNYRKFIGTNNVAKISWKKHNSSSDPMTGGGVSGANETGKAIDSEDFTYERNGIYYQLSPYAQKMIYDNPALGAVIPVLFTNVEIRTKYFVPVGHAVSSHKNLSHAPAHTAKGFELEFELNKGDPFLRPPRTAHLNCGTFRDDFSDLPSFLFHQGTQPATFNINEVTTSLTHGMIQTKGVMTA